MHEICFGSANLSNSILKNRFLIMMIFAGLLINPANIANSQYSSVSYENYESAWDGWHSHSVLPSTDFKDFKYSCKSMCSEFGYPISRKHSEDYGCRSVYDPVYQYPQEICDVSRQICNCFSGGYTERFDIIESIDKSEPRYWLSAETVKVPVLVFKIKRN